MMLCKFHRLLCAIFFCLVWFAASAQPVPSRKNPASNAEIVRAFVDEDWKKFQFFLEGRDALASSVETDRELLRELVEQFLFRRPPYSNKVVEQLGLVWQKFYDSSASDDGPTSSRTQFLVQDLEEWLGRNPEIWQVNRTADPDGPASKLFNLTKKVIRISPTDSFVERVLFGSDQNNKLVVLDGADWLSLVDERMKAGRRSPDFAQKLLAELSRRSDIAIDVVNSQADSPLRRTMLNNLKAYMDRLNGFLSVGTTMGVQDFARESATELKHLLSKYAEVPSLVGDWTVEAKLVTSVAAISKLNESSESPAAALSENENSAGLWQLFRSRPHLRHYSSAEGPDAGAYAGPGQDERFALANELDKMREELAESFRADDNEKGDTQKARYIVAKTIREVVEKAGSDAERKCILSLAAVSLPTDSGVVGPAFRWAMMEHLAASGLRSDAELLAWIDLALAMELDPYSPTKSSLSFGGDATKQLPASHYVWEALQLWMEREQKRQASSSSMLKARVRSLLVEHPLWGSIRSKEKKIVQAQLGILSELEVAQVRFQTVLVQNQIPSGPEDQRLIRALLLNKSYSPEEEALLAIRAAIVRDADRAKVHYDSVLGSGFVERRADHLNLIERVEREIGVKSPSRNLPRATDAAEAERANAKVKKQQVWIQNHFSKVLPNLGKDLSIGPQEVDTPAALLIGEAKTRILGYPEFLNALDPSDWSAQSVYLSNLHTLLGRLRFSLAWFQSRSHLPSDDSPFGKFAALKQLQELAETVVQEAPKWGGAFPTDAWGAVVSQARTLDLSANASQWNSHQYRLDQSLSPWQSREKLIQAVITSQNGGFPSEVLRLDWKRRDLDLAKYWLFGPQDSVVGTSGVKGWLTGLPERAQFIAVLMEHPQFLEVFVDQWDDFAHPTGVQFLESCKGHSGASQICLWQEVMSQVLRSNNPRLAQIQESMWRAVQSASPTEPSFVYTDFLLKSLPQDKLQAWDTPVSRKILEELNKNVQQALYFLDDSKDPWIKGQAFLVLRRIADHATERSERWKTVPPEFRQGMNRLSSYTPRGLRDDWSWMNQELFALGKNIAGLNLSGSLVQATMVQPLACSDLLKRVIGGSGSGSYPQDLPH